METVKGWEQDPKALLGRLAGQFRNRSGRERLEAYVKGLLGSAERKNSWQLAEQTGESTPYAMQQFISSAFASPASIEASISSRWSK